MAKRESALGTLPNVQRLDWGPEDAGVSVSQAQAGPGREQLTHSRFRGKSNKESTCRGVGGL